MHLGGQSLNLIFCFPIQHFSNKQLEQQRCQSTGETHTHISVDKGRGEGILEQRWGVKRLWRAGGDHG